MTVIIQIESRSGEHCFLHVTRTSIPSFVASPSGATHMDSVVADRWVHWLNFNSTCCVASALRATE